MSLVEEEFWVGWDHHYTLLKCLGCETVSLRQKSWFSEDGRDDVRITFFPPQASRPAPPWIDELEAEMAALLREIYAALHVDSRRLAMMGARAALDVYIVGKVGDVGAFRSKLKALEGAGHISPQQRTLLDAALDAGNAASHRGHLASPKELSLVMDIVETLLHLDLLHPAADALRRSTPRRNALPPNPAESVS